MSNSLQGRTVAVFGVANKRSIAWAIAQQMQQAGAQLAITYQNERLKQEADDLIAALPNAQAFQCDVSRDEEIAQLFEQLKSTLRQARRAGAQRRLCARRRTEGRVRRLPAARAFASRSISASIRWSRWPAPPGRS